MPPLGMLAPLPNIPLVVGAEVVTILGAEMVTLPVIAVVIIAAPLVLRVTANIAAPPLILRCIAIISGPILCCTGASKGRESGPKYDSL